LFVRIDNTPRDYAWGSTTAIAELLGRPASGKPEAELWLGAHPGSSSVILDPESAGGARNLSEWIARDPVAALGAHEVSALGEPRLPYLLKVLAAAAPLSLQAHPSTAQAQDGFANEDARGIPIGASNRNYKDSFHKPEMIYALSETFEALCGFRPVVESISDFAGLAALAAQAGVPHFALAEFVQWLETPGDEVEILRSAVQRLLSDDVDLADFVSKLVSEAVEAARLDGQRTRFEIVERLSASYPGDPGIVIALLLHRVTLRKGEALFLPAGNLHAYLKGLGVELMAASDNVLRGGLTPKHVDVDELLAVLDFEPIPVPYLKPVAGQGIETFRPGLPDFELIRVAPLGADPVPVSVIGPAIYLCTSGELTVTSAATNTSVTVRRGEAFYVTPEDDDVEVTGHGELFVAAQNL
jgi:mannose-6-phosphate isomerase